LVHQALPIGALAGHALGFQPLGAFADQATGLAVDRHGIEVAQRRVDQARGNPAAGPLPRRSLLQQDIAQRLQEALYARGIVVGKVLGLDHLGQRVGSLTHPLQHLGRDVRRQSRHMPQIGQAKRHGLGSGNGAG